MTPIITDTDGLLITGGYSSFSSLSSVEFWSPEGRSCVLPSLPRGMAYHTVDLLGDKIVVCLYTSCLQFVGGAWAQLGRTVKKRWRLGSTGETVKKRWLHTSEVIQDRILLVGGVLL